MTWLRLTNINDIIRWHRSICHDDHYRRFACSIIVSNVSVMDSFIASIREWTMMHICIYILFFSSLPLFFYVHPHWLKRHDQWISQFITKRERNKWNKRFFLSLSPSGLYKADDLQQNVSLLSSIPRLLFNAQYPV
jgi:hypothetical protein